MKEPAVIPIEPFKDSPALREWFAPFGVIAAIAQLPARRVANGRVEIRSVLTGEPAQDGMTAAIDIYDIAPSPMPIELRVLERHPTSFQTFVPLSVETLVVAICPADAAGEPDLRGLRAFRVGPGRTVTYHRGVWHMGMMSLHAPARMAMIMHRTGGDDTEFRSLAVPVMLAF